MSRTPDRTLPDDLVATALLVALTAITAAGFVRVFADWAFLRPVLAVGLVVHLACWVARRLRWPGWVALPLMLVVLAEVLTVVYYRDTLRWGLPSRDTLAYLRVDLRLVWSQFPTAVAPVPSASPFAVLAGASIGMVAIVSDTFAFRALGRIEALVPSAVVFVFTAALGVDRSRVALTAGWFAIALATVAVLRAVHSAGSDGWLGRRRAAGAATLPAAATGAALCAVGAALVGPLLPGAGQQPIIDTRAAATDDGAVLSPLVDLRARLVNRSEVEMFSVATVAGRYWRLSALDDFDGTTWTFTDADVEPVEGTFGEPSPTAALVQQQVVVGRLGGRLLPAAAEPVQVSQLGIGWQQRTATLLLIDGGLERGQTFNIASDVGVPSTDALRRASVGAAPGGSLDLPADFPSSVVALAREVTAGAATPYDQALALQQFFRENFVYDIDVQRGHSDSAILSFLRERRGYCEQFSAAFAAMARSIGLPARVAVGFTQGDLRSDGRYHVLGRHAHAWPEVWFDGIGWVLFEPTPGRGAPGSEDVTGVAASQALPDERPTSDTATTVAPTTTTPTATTRPAPGTATTVTATTVVAAGPVDDEGPGAGSVIWWMIAAGAMWAILVPGAVRRFTKVGDTPAEQVVSAWHGAVAGAVLAGADPPGGATPLEYARRVEQQLGIDGRPLLELARFVTRAVYSPTGVAEPTALRAAVLRTQVNDACDELLPWPARWRSRLDPRLVRRRLVGAGRVSDRGRGPGGPAASPQPA